MLRRLPDETDGRDPGAAGYGGPRGRVHLGGTDTGRERTLLSAWLDLALGWTLLGLEVMTLGGRERCRFQNQEKTPLAWVGSDAAH